jgi:hypothetical protein
LRKLGTVDVKVDALVAKKSKAARMELEENIEVVR